MKKTTPEAEAAKALGPLIRLGAEKRGTMTAVRRSFEKRNGRRWNRENFERWLAVDPKRRVEPRFGCGLILLQIQNDKQT